MLEERSGGKVHGCGRGLRKEGRRGGKVDRNGEWGHCRRVGGGQVSVGRGGHGSLSSKKTL
eukprot:755463-Hanusia_phi.AAC.2